MKYRGHLMGGAAAAAAVVGTANALLVHGAPISGLALATGVAGALIGSLAPDLDSRGAYLARRTFGLYYVFRLCLSNPIVWFLVGLRQPERGGAMRTLWAGRRRTVALIGHRALSHSIVGTAAATLLWAGLLAGTLALAGEISGWQRIAAELGYLRVGGLATVPVVLLGTYGFFLGYASHLLLDMMTISGVPLFLPWSSTRYHVLPAPLRVRSN